MIGTTLHHADLVDSCAIWPHQSLQGIYIDPPYNTTNTKKKYDSELFRRKRWTNFHADWDAWSSQGAYRADVYAWIEAMRPLLVSDGSMFVCGSHHSIPTWDLALRKMGFWIVQWVQWLIPNSMPNIAMSQMVSSNQTIIWARKSKKGKHVYNSDIAKQYNNGKNMRDYWIINNDSQAGRLWKHPSKKPVSLISLQLELTTHPGDPVADFFAGSGTTGVAAAGLERPCLLVERHAPYIPMIEQRLNVTAQVIGKPPAYPGWYGRRRWRERQQRQEGVNNGTTSVL